jgi:16S rRNA (cytosine1402-N4)-methyltransferase
MQSPYQPPHQPVMLNEVLKSLNPEAGGLYIDGTFGAGGYSKAILNASECNLIAIDRDPNVEPYITRLTTQFPERFCFKQGKFADMADLCADYMGAVDGIVLDIGVSSMQLDEAGRGFSFRYDAPLDMRMSATGATAADLVNNLSETELANLIWRYGEEKFSRKIAAKIIELRKTQPIKTTFALRDIIYQIIRPRADKIDPATRTFQALRIAVNDELEQLKQGLHAALRLLKVGGRLVVVSFHSLEDRIVKRFFSQMSGEQMNISRHIPTDFNNPIKQYLALPKQKSIKASSAEIKLNHRSRSSIMRYAIRTDEPYFGDLYA